jgi:hypothetical protein
MNSRYGKREFKLQQQEPHYRHTSSTLKENLSGQGDRKPSPEQKFQLKSQHNPLPKREFKPQHQQPHYRHTASTHKEDLSGQGDRKPSPEQKFQLKSQHSPLPKKHLPLDAVNGKDADHARAAEKCAIFGSPAVNWKTGAVRLAQGQPTNNYMLSLQDDHDHDDHVHNCGKGSSLGQFRDENRQCHAEPAPARRIILYTQRSTKSLLEDDDDEEASVRDRFLQGIAVPNHNVSNDDKLASMVNTHPDLQSVLEVFPNSDPDRIVHLLRQKSLTATLLMLAEESSETDSITTCRPSDDLLLPPGLTYATTYAQGNDEHRAIIMTYLTEMFPEIPRIEIESVLMSHSTHQAVSILTEWPSGQVLKRPPPVPAAAAAAAAAMIPAPCKSMKHALPPRPSRRSSDNPHPALLKRRPLRSPIDDDDDDAWRPSHHRT